MVASHGNHRVPPDSSPMLSMTDRLHEIALPWPRNVATEAHFVIDTHQLSGIFKLTLSEIAKSNFRHHLKNSSANQGIDQMKNNRITAALVMLATTSAFAQPTAQLKNVEGNVLVSTAQGAVAGINGLALPDKTLVTTTSNGLADVVTPAGCTISLKPNQRLEVDVTKTCEALLALVTTAPGAVALGAGGTAAGLSGSTIAMALGGVAGAAILINRNNRNSSPN